VPGLDAILNGGLVPNCVYLVEGDPGAGKTTLALQFLLAAAKKGEPSMFVTLSENESELRASAASHGWSLDGINIVEVIASEESLTPDSRYTMYHPSEVELATTTKSVLDRARTIKPTRLVFDSLSELRILAEHPLRYRRQILALKQYFARQPCTVLLIDDRTTEDTDMHLHSMVHGVISLDSKVAEFGTLRRRLHVRKLRGRAFREGFHDCVIRRGGLQVFPRLVAAEHRKAYSREPVLSGLERLDTLLGGGLAKGTSSLITGPAGSGKSSLATQYVHTLAQNGGRAAMFLFDEALDTLKERSAGLGLDIEPFIDSGNISVRQIDPAELSPGEFSQHMRTAVEEYGASIVVIDSLSGYLNAMPSERFLTLHLHELLTYLSQQGVTTLLLLTQHGLTEHPNESVVDTSYLADTVLLLRYFESFGEVRQALSVIKKRTGRHERTIRELNMNGGIKIGEPLREFQGVLSGVPEYLGERLAEKS
jgi:circadian clock protein KaiC